MGQRTSSCASTTSFETAKLILQDGSLEDFLKPTKVSHILSSKPNTFLCNADEMEFDVAITAVKDNDELQLGQLYFALPLNRLNRRLRAEEMVTLALKANEALLKSNGGGRRKWPKKNEFYGGGGGGAEREWTTWSSTSLVAAKTVVKSGSVGGYRNGNGRRRGMSLGGYGNLSVIYE